jgi:hypothetical protein
MTILMVTSPKKGFRRSPSELTLYVKHGETGMLIVSLYVDDLIFYRK